MSKHTEKDNGIPSEESRYMTLQEFADYSRLGMTTARRLCRGCNGFTFRVGNRIYVDRLRYDAWVAKQIY